MATVVKGARTSASGMASDRQIVSMGGLYKLEDDQGALMVTATKLGAGKKALSYQHSWHTSELRPKFDTVNNSTGYASSATSIIVSNNTYHQAYDLVKVTRTGEVLMVTAVNTGGAAIEVTRSWGATAAAALVDADELLILGPAYPENAVLQSPRSVTEVSYSNYTEIVEHSFTISETERAIGRNGGHYHGPDEETQRTDMNLTHKRDLNLKYLFSEKGSSGTQRTMDGIIPFIKANATTRIDSTSAYTESVMIDVIGRATRYGSKKKLGICSRQFLNIVNKHAIGQQRVVPGASLYGLEVVDYVTGNGQVKLVVDDALEGTEYSQYCVFVDVAKDGGPKAVNLRNTFVEKIGSADETSRDGYTEKIVTEGTLELTSPQYHYLVDNANTAS